MREHGGVPSLPMVAGLVFSSPLATCEHNLEAGHNGQETFKVASSDNQIMMRRLTLGLMCSEEKNTDAFCLVCVFCSSLSSFFRPSDAHMQGPSVDLDCVFSVSCSGNVGHSGCVRRMHGRQVRSWLSTKAEGEILEFARNENEAWHKVAHGVLVSVFFSDLCAKALHCTG